MQQEKNFYHERVSISNIEKQQKENTHKRRVHLGFGYRVHADGQNMMSINELVFIKLDLLFLDLFVSVLVL